MTAAPWAEQWLASRGSRLTWLRDRAGECGGPAAAQLDLSPASLVPLWAWARRRFTRRPPDQLVDRGALPVWFGDPAAWTPTWWDDETVWLADALIVYVADLMIATHPGARWEVWHEPSPDIPPYEGQPVLVRVATQPWHPWTYVPNVIGRVWVGTACDEDLLKLYELYPPRS